MGPPKIPQVSRLLICAERLAPLFISFRLESSGASLLRYPLVVWRFQPKFGWGFGGLVVVKATWESWLFILRLRQRGQITHAGRAVSEGVRHAYETRQKKQVETGCLTAVGFDL